MTWNRKDGRIYALVVAGQRQDLHALDPASRKWTRLDVDMDVVETFDLAADAPLGVALGSGATLPQRLALVDLRRGQSRVIVEPAAEHYRDIRLGRVEDWPAKLPSGERLDGRVYYPLDFDPARKYPCIVYYYGGTTPVGRDFGGRYPKNVWAGLGYFVYVPQPSGATGYGQEFAARHVNDWGARTAQEVIDGTQAFLAAHPFVDKARLACIGASYGGFLTEYLLTRTDMFACGISHAGISSIAGYWGEGYWGYDYGARALADAFPWSHRDLYVNQSALFSADKIRTPLLLLHGSADTNVPPGESDQLYTALKLLGREVEYVRIEGQNHHIINRDQRILWNDTILAWFAKWLKSEPEWWNELYAQ
jgi:dipeptidyl aminopeptidase/acylaminoacyl peptidase